MFYSGLARLYQCSYCYNIATVTHFGSIIKRTPSILNHLSRTARARGHVSGVGVANHRYAERNGTKRRAAASTCLERLRITAKQFDLFENAMVWVQ